MTQSPQSPEAVALQLRLSPERWAQEVGRAVVHAVTVRSTPAQCLYQFHANPRNPQLMAQLTAALLVINQLELSRGKQKLRFEVAPAQGRGP